MSYEEEIDLLRNEIFEFRKGEDTRIVISELMARIDVQADRIAELEAQVAALKKIAIKEKASGLFNGPWDSGLPDDCGYDAEIEACRTEARRQLSEEHPEAFR